MKSKVLSKIAAISLCAATLASINVPIMYAQSSVVSAATTKKKTTKKKTTKKKTTKKKTTKKKTTKKKTTKKKTTKKSAPKKAKIISDRNEYLANDGIHYINTVTSNAVTAVVAETFPKAKTVKMTHNSYAYDANGKVIKNSKNKNLDASSKYNHSTKILGYKFINGEPYYAVDTANMKSTKDEKLTNKSNVVFMKAANFNGNVNDIVKVVATPYINGKSTGAPSKIETVSEYNKTDNNQISLASKPIKTPKLAKSTSKVTTTNADQMHHVSADLGNMGSANMRGGVVKVTKKSTSENQATTSKAVQNAILGSKQSVASQAVNVKVITNTLNNAKITKADDKAKLTVKKDTPIYVKNNDGKMVNVTQTANALNNTTIQPVAKAISSHEITSVQSPISSATMKNNEATKTNAKTNINSNVSTPKQIKVTDQAKTTKTVTAMANAKKPSIDEMNKTLIAQDMIYASNITHTTNAGSLQEIDGNFIFTPSESANDDAVSGLQKNIQLINKLNETRTDLRNKLTQNQVSVNDYNSSMEQYNSEYETARDKIYNSFNALSKKAPAKSVGLISNNATVITPTKETQASQAKVTSPTASLTSTGRVITNSVSTASLNSTTNYGVPNVGSELKAGTKIDTKNLVATSGGIFYRLAVNGQTVYVPFIDGFVNVK